MNLTFETLFDLWGVDARKAPDFVTNNHPRSVVDFAHSRLVQQRDRLKARLALGDFSRHQQRKNVALDGAALEVVLAHLERATTRIDTSRISDDAKELVRLRREITQLGHNQRQRVEGLKHRQLLLQVRLAERERRHDALSCGIYGGGVL